MSDIATSASSLLEERAIRKITWRLIPFLMLLYFVAFLDRINVGFAALTMNKDIGLTARMFGLGSGIFFLGYFIFEVPSTIILHKVGARFWIGRVMITWESVSIAMAFTEARSASISSGSCSVSRKPVFSRESFSISATGFPAIIARR